MNPQRNYRVTLFTMCVFAIITAGCAAVPPAQPGGYERIARNSLPMEQGPILFAERFEWLPGTYGYEKTLESKIDKRFYSGILVCSETSVYFLAYIGNEYVPRLKMDYADIATVALHKYGYGRRVVVQNKRYETHTFQALSGTGLGVDRQHTETAFAVLQRRVKK